MITRQKLINLSSASSSVNGSNKSSLSFQIADFFRKSKTDLYSTITLQNAQIPVSWYVIDERNNQIFVDGVPYIIPSANYDVYTFRDLFNSLDTGLSIDINISTLKYTLTCTSFFTFSTSAGGVLGFENNKVYVSTSGFFIDAPFVCNFSGVKKILVCSDFFGDGIFDNGFQTFRGVISSIPVTQDQGGIISYSNFGNSEKSFLLRSEISYFDITFRDEQYRLINFNGQDIFFSLLIETKTNEIPQMALTLQEIQQLQEELLNNQNSK